MKSLWPKVEDVNKEFDKLQSLSNGQLRNKTVEFRESISENLSDIDAKIAKLKESIESQPDMEPEEKENIFSYCQRFPETCSNVTRHCCRF